MQFDIEYLERLRDFYRGQLLNDTLPFWFPRSIDKEYGGYLLMRDQDGSLLDDDKAVWIQGRFAWLLSTLYNTVEPRKEWLEGAKCGIDFLRKYCFDTDGRMFFHMTREGLPVRKRRYFASENFAVMAFAAYAKASNDQKLAAEAIELYRKCLAYTSGEIPLPRKFTQNRFLHSFGAPMIMINVAQQVRSTIGCEGIDEQISKWISTIETLFVKHDIRCVMEKVGSDGQISDHFDGRTLNPGHAIEGAWFILYEAKQRNNDKTLIRLGCAMLDYMWERGWDQEHGGIFYFRDVANKPVHEYWHDMKFWWPHNETIIATLLAYLLTGNEKYAQWHRQVHEYAYSRFHDKKNGEWFGYLHQDGKLSVTTKGNLFKGPFHLPRQELVCWQLLEEYLPAVK